MEAIARIRQRPELAPLFNIPMWACSGGTLDNGKPNKAPRDYRTPWKHGKSNDPATWGTLDQIEQAARRYPQLIDHIGIISGQNGIRVLDWDYKKSEGQPAVVATQAKLFGHSYQETSLSGLGLRCLIYGESLPMKKTKFSLEPDVDLEVFSSHQYAILTGNTTNPMPICEAGEELNRLLNALRPESEKPQPKRSTPRSTYTGDDASPWEAASNTWRIGDLLERQGYPRKGVGRYLSPNSSTGLAGVTVYRDEQGKEKCKSYHSNDPLANGHANDAFDVFAILEHGGDYRAATRAARELLGLNRPEPTPKFTDTPLTAEQSAGLWDQFEVDLLEKAMQHLASLPLHHNARDALMNVLTWVYHSAAEGNLTDSKEGMVLSVGGMKQFAAVIGGRPADCKARLSWLADHGMVTSFRAIDPRDPNSGRVIVLPADPLSLPFLSYQPTPSGPVSRPQTNPVRSEGNVYRTPCNTSLAKAGGSVNSQNQKNPLRALLSVALTLSRHPGLSLEKLAQKTGARLPTIRKRLSQLAELGYLTAGGSLRCTFQQFFSDLRAWGAEQAGRRLTTTLERQREYAKRGLMLARFGVEEFKGRVSRMRQMLKTAESKLTRLSDGEMPHSVLGRAA